MDSKPSQLHILLLPYFSRGHMIPTVDMARLFAKHGVKATIVTTPTNAPLFSAIIEQDRQLGLDIGIRVIKFPCVEARLPEACENVNSIASLEMVLNFYKAVNLLQKPFEQVLEECRPHCIVAGLLFPWATDIAANFGIPRLCFHGTGVFALSVLHGLRQHKPYKTITSDFEPFTVPGLPDQVKITRQQLPSFIKEETENNVRSMLDQCIKSEMSSYGVLVNSFHELEPGYSEHYRKVIGKKTWYIGPVSLCNRDTSDKVQQRHECLRWLDSKQPNTVIYICFGSLMHFSAAKQLFEIAMALEATGQNFIWVVKKEDKDKEEWLPEGFEMRVEGRGLIIRGWAPQVLILDHEAIRGFMTHCGWNSILESVIAGVPMVTWPLSAEQFYNEKLVTDVLKIGVGVGAQESSLLLEKKINIVKRDDVKEAIIKLIAGEEGEKMRIRAGKLKEMARRATEEGGSSYSDLNAFLEELKLTVKVPVKQEK